MFLPTAALLLAALVGNSPNPARAIDGGVLRMNPRNGWKAFEIITVGDDAAGDGVDWAMPGTFDGLGVWSPDAATLRIVVNHENSDATISEVDLNLVGFQTAIDNVILRDSTEQVSFVVGARQAYGRWSNDGGDSWSETSGIADTSFSRFCSGQSYAAEAFGPDRGFVDDIYITGEEVSGGRLFALDQAERDFYQLSGVVGEAPGGFGGMPFDAWENAALLDTGESNHIALLLSPDGGTQRMTLFIGEKGKDAAGEDATDFLSRNGLSYGSYYYLVGRMPGEQPLTDGTFSADRRVRGILASSKFEDVDTNPNAPTQVVLGDQDSGLFTFDFNLDFTSGAFDSDSSGFDMTRIQEHVNDVDGQFGDADNVDWTFATTLGGVSYPNGLVFVNEDTGTGNGEIWQMEPDGAALHKIGDTLGISGATETTGILDVSMFVGYAPGSILLTANQGTNSSLTALINPNAVAVPEPSSLMLAAVGLFAVGRRVWSRRKARRPNLTEFKDER